MKSQSAAIPIELAREIARQGDARLGALMALATAADLRATTLCGIFGAASVGTGAAVLADLASDHASASLILAGSVAALGLFAASIFAATAGAPRDFWIAGGNPDLLREWSWAAGRWRDEADMLDATGARQAESIAKDKAILERGSKKLATSLWIAFASPLLGIVAYVAARYCT